MQNDTLTFLDNRTGKSYEFPITDGTVRGMDLRQIKTSEGDYGLKAYDPSYLNTASCRSQITYIDGDKGILRYRGYPIEQLAEQSTFLEVAYLLLYNELPTQAQLDRWVSHVKSETMMHESIRQFLDAFRHDAHPMGILVGTVAALSTFYPDAHNVHDIESVKLQTRRLVAKMPTLAAFAYRHSKGFPYVYPDNDLSYTGNFLNMMFRMDEAPYQPDPVLERALDVLFILHADHEQNCSTSTMRVVGSTNADPYAAVAAACVGPFRAAARRRQRSCPAHVERDRRRVQHSRIHGQRPARRAAADGLRPPRLQELRPAGQHHQESCLRCLRGNRAATHCSTSQLSWKTSPSTKTTSSNASCIPTSISTAASSTRRSTCPPACSP